MGARGTRAGIVPLTVTPPMASVNIRVRSLRPPRPLATTRRRGYDRTDEPLAGRHAQRDTPLENERVLRMTTDGITRRGFVEAVGAPPVLRRCWERRRSPRAAAQREGPHGPDRRRQPGQPVARLVPAAGRGRYRRGRRRQRSTRRRRRPSASRRPRATRRIRRATTAPCSTARMSTP